MKRPIEAKRVNVTEFPGSKAVSEASTKYGPALVSSPVFFVFEKVSTFIVPEEKEVEAPPPPPATEEETSGKEKEKDITEEKAVEEKAETAPPEPPKVEEAEPPKP